MKIANLRETAEHRLSEPVEYADHGETKQTLELSLVCPSTDQWGDATKLRKAFSKAIVEHIAFMQDRMDIDAVEAAKLAAAEKTAADANDQDDGYQFDRDDVCRIVELSDTFDLPKNIKVLGRLLTSGCGLVEGKTMNQIQWSKVTPEDREEVLISFLENFIQPFALRATGLLSTT